MSSDILKTIQEAVAARASESGARNAVASTLARYGYAKMPTVEAGKSGTDTVRVYTWWDSPAGDVALVTGPNLISEVHLLDGLAPAKAPKGPYVQMEPVVGAAVKKLTAGMKTSAKTVATRRRSAAKAIADIPAYVPKRRASKPRGVSAAVAEVVEAVSEAPKREALAVIAEAPAAVVKAAAEELTGEVVSTAAEAREILEDVVQEPVAAPSKPRRAELSPEDKAAKAAAFAAQLKAMLRGK